MTFSASSLFPFPSECWHNIAETRVGNDGALELSRVPFAILPSLNEKAQERAVCPAGAELRFRMRGPEVKLTLRRMADKNVFYKLPAASLAGVYQGDYQTGWFAIGGEDATITIRPTPSAANLVTRRLFDPALKRVVLPVFPGVQLVSFEGEIDPPREEDVPRVNYLAYGSSITHGAYTPLGTGTYPAVIARELGVDVANMGFGGGAHLEPELADWLAAREDWDFASLELGINILGRVEVEEFRARVKRFLAPFVADARQRPVICLDILRHQQEFRREDAKAEAFRAIVAEETALLGSPRFQHVPFFDVLKHVTGLADDLVHPTPAGFEEIGRCLAERFRTVPAVAALLG